MSELGRKISVKSNDSREVQEKSHKTIIFHHHVEAPFRKLICIKFDQFVDLTDVITPAKFGSKIFIGFSRPRGRKTRFPLAIKRYIEQCHALPR